MKRLVLVPLAACAACAAPPEDPDLTGVWRECESGPMLVHLNADGTARAGTFFSFGGYFEGEWRWEGAANARRFVLDGEHYGLGDATPAEPARFVLALTPREDGAYDYVVEEAAPLSGYQLYIRAGGSQGNEGCWTRVPVEELETPD